MRESVLTVNYKFLSVAYQNPFFTLTFMINYSKCSIFGKVVPNDHKKYFQRYITL